VSRPERGTCRLEPVPPELADRLAAGDLGELTRRGLRVGRGWPHDDTVHAFTFAAGGGRTWLVVDDGIVAGELGTKGPADAEGRVEIGYGLAPPSRGRGLGTAAVGRLLDELATDAAVRTVVAHVAVDNVASRRLLERLGFALVGEAGNGEVRYERPTWVVETGPRQVRFT
jgi:RimJ/RimL family protein N-acetyltransferase